MDKELQRINNAPLPIDEPADWQHSTKEAGETFFAPCSTVKKTTHQNETQPKKQNATTTTTINP
jgi:hypothetical protein